jgi:hypothetical protein
MLEELFKKVVVVVLLEVTKKLEVGSLDSAIGWTTSRLEFIKNIRNDDFGAQVLLLTGR